MKPVTAKMKVACEPTRRGGWPLISPCINPPSLGINNLHCVEFSHHMRKFLLKFSLGEPLVVVKELPHFDNLINMKLLLASALDLCVHNMIGGFLLHAIRFELFQFQLVYYL